MFRRNLFKFTALNSFKIVWVVSVVLFTCVIANAQVGQVGREKAVVQCIENLKVTSKAGEYGKILTVSFRTKEEVEAEVTVEKWGSYSGSKADWRRVTDSQGITEEGVFQRIKAAHRFEIGLNYVDPQVPGNKYRLKLRARSYKDTYTQPGGYRRSLDRTFNCQKEFTVGLNLFNLRLKSKPKQ